jgi:hypothetical protein
MDRWEPRRYTPAEEARIAQVARKFEDAEVILLYQDLAAFERGER